MSTVFPNLEDVDNESIFSLSLTAVFIINHVKSEVVSDWCMISLDKWYNLEGMGPAIKGPQNFQSLPDLVLHEVKSVTHNDNQNILQHCLRKLLKSKVWSPLLRICTH